jgi:uncharacterized membrane protein YtjA (UPF0391 family)
MLLLWKNHEPSLQQLSIRKRRRFSNNSEKELLMSLLTWAIIAAVIAIIAGALGFTGVAAGAASIARLLFAIFIIIAIILFIMVVLGIGVVDNAAVSHLFAIYG